MLFFSGQTKVSESQLAVISNEDISRLDISMNNVIFVNDMQPLKDLSHKNLRVEWYL